MKIICISDTHNLHKDLKILDGDIFQILKKIKCLFINKSGLRLNRKNYESQIEVIYEAMMVELQLSPP